MSELLRLVDRPDASGEKVAALRAWRDAQVARDAAERRLQAANQESAAAGAASAEPPEIDYDGWAPRDVPLLPSPIHRQLLDPSAPPSWPAGAVLVGLPEPGTLPDLGYLAAWKRPLVRALGRLLLALSSFLALPQRRINAQIQAALAELARQQGALDAALQTLASRTLDNFLFLDGAQREQLLEMHRQLARQQSVCRGEVARQVDDLRQELAAELEQKSPRHRLALLELELAVAEARSQSAWQRFLAAEIDERVAAAEKAIGGAAAE